MRAKLVALLPGPVRAAVLNLRLRRGDHRAGVVLLYHVIGDGEGNPASELVPAISVRRFRRQLRHLRRFYEVVPLSELPAAVERRGRGGRFPVAITFDDDSPEHVEHALPALGSEGLRATFFLTGAGLADGPAESRWWERLQRVYDRGNAGEAVARLLPAAKRPADIHSVGEAIETLPPPARARLSAALVEWAGPDPPHPALGDSDVRRIREAGHSIGFHTLDHVRLSELADAELNAALERGRAELENTCGGRIATIAYPHGDADRRVADAAREAGFELGVTGARAAMTPATDRMLIGRLEPLAPRTGAPSNAGFELDLVRTLLIAE